MINGKIIKGIGGFYYVDTEKGLYECRARGIFRKNKITPLVGDFVKISVVDEENKKGRILRQERYAGVCSRSFYVGDVKPEEVKAKYESGVLTIALPKEDARKCSSCNTITIE